MYIYVNICICIFPEMLEGKLSIQYTCTTKYFSVYFLKQNVVLHDQDTIMKAKNSTGDATPLSNLRTVLRFHSLPHVFSKRKTMLSDAGSNPQPHLPLHGCPSPLRRGRLFGSFLALPVFKSQASHSGDCPALGSVRQEATEVRLALLARHSGGA